MKHGIRDINETKLMLDGIVANMADQRGSVRSLRSCDQVMVTVGSFLGFFLVHGMLCSFHVIRSQIVAEFKTTIHSVEWIASLYHGVMVGSGCICGVLLQYIQCRTLAMIGCLLMMVGMGASVFMSNALQIYITMGLLSGFGAGFIQMASIIIIVENLTDHCCVALAFASCGIGAGTLTMPPLTRLYDEHYGWRSTFLFMTIISLVGILSAVFYHPIHRRRFKNQDLGWLRYGAEIQEHRDQYRARFRDVSFVIKRQSPQNSRDALAMKMLNLRCWLYALFVIAGVMVFLVHDTPIMLLHKMASEQKLTEHGHYNMDLTATFTNFAGSIGLGVLCDFRPNDKMAVYIFNLMLISLACFLSPMVESYEFFLAVMGVLGVCLGVFAFLQPLVLADLVGRGTAALALGIMMMFEGIVVTFGTSLTEWLADHTGKNHAGFYFAGGFFFLGGLLSLIIPIWKTVQAKKVEIIHYNSQSEHKDHNEIEQNQQHTDKECHK